MLLITLPTNHIPTTLILLTVSQLHYHNHLYHQCIIPPVNHHVFNRFTVFLLVFCLICYGDDDDCSLHGGTWWWWFRWMWHIMHRSMRLIDYVANILATAMCSFWCNDGETIWRYVHVADYKSKLVIWWPFCVHKCSCQSASKHG